MTEFLKYPNSWNEESLESRRLLRLEKSKRIRVWSRSPSPPKQNEKSLKQNVHKKNSTKLEKYSISDLKSSAALTVKDRVNDLKDKVTQPVQQAVHDKIIIESEPLQYKTNDLFLDEANMFYKEIHGSRIQFPNDNDDDDEIGPKLSSKITDDSKDKTHTYGKALLPGEGAAIAQFVQQNMRIPRRGEIGWQGDDIQQLEDTGYVMSGSRHKKMNAVRLRKENQVYSAEEKRALALITMEEKQQKENKVIAEFRQTLQQTLPGK